MAEFVSSFITGFQDVVSSDLPARLKGCKIINIFDGLVHYSYSGNPRDLEKILYFNNTFFVIKTVKGNGVNFPSLVGVVGAENKNYMISRGTFRVRFVKENQFAKVDKNIARRAEETVTRNSKLFLDRVSPSTEVWYSIRRQQGKERRRRTRRQKRTHQQYIYHEKRNNYRQWGNTKRQGGISLWHFLLGRRLHNRKYWQL